MAHLKKTSATILSLSLLAGGYALAHSGATGVVKMRMDMMSDIASQMKTIGQMLKGEKPFNATVAKEAAAKVKGHSEGLSKAFPEGSIKGPSEALPSIWKNWDEFQSQLKQMETAAAALEVSAKSASSTKDILPAFKELGATCSACHQDFRKK